MAEASLLEQEALYLYRVFFGATIDQTTLDRYIQAHRHFCLTHDATASRLMTTLLRNDLDAEAVEYVLRLKSRDNILTRKVEIIHYLAECRQSRSSDFFPVDDKDRFVWPGIFLALFRSARCFIHGHYLVRKHKLA